MNVETAIKQFNRLNTAMDVLLRDDVNNKVRIIVCSGTAGVGKSHTVLKRLESEHEKGNINLFTLEGDTSPVHMYMKLYEARHQYSVLVIDDSDSILRTRVGLEFLKHATESNRRIVQYNKQSTILKHKQIPNHFEFNGKIIVLSNIDFAEEMQNNKSLGEHYTAVLSRGTYVDLVFKNRTDIISYIEYVVRSTRMLQLQGVSQHEEKQIMEFMRQNMNSLITVTLRTPTIIASILINDERNWQDTAKALLCRGY